MGVGLAVLWIRLLLRVSRLPLVLDRLTVLTTTNNPDEMAMRDLVYYVDRWLHLFPYNERVIVFLARWPSTGLLGEGGIRFIFIAA